MSKPAEPFNPHYKWLGIPPSEQPANHYRLLGVSLFESNADVISNAVDRIMGHIRGFQTGKHAREAQQVLTEISLAKVVLLNPKKKAAYDAELQSAMDLEDPLADPLPEAISLDPVPEPSPTPFTDIAEPESATVTSRARDVTRTSSSAAGMGMVGVAIAVLLFMGAIGVAFVAAPSLFDTADEEVDVASNGNPDLADNGNDISTTTDGVDANQPNPAVTADGVEPEQDAGEAATDTEETDGSTPNIPAPPSDGEEPVGPTPPTTVDPDIPTDPPRNLTPLPGTEDADDSKDPPPVVPTSLKADIPAVADRQSQRQRITDLFSTAEATTPETRIVLSKRLFDAAAISQGNPAEHFVLLNISRELACQAGDAALAFKAITAMDQAFKMDADQVKVLSIREVVAAQAPIEVRKNAVPLGVVLVRDLLDRREYVKAVALISELQTISRRFQDRDSLVELADLKKVTAPLAEQQTQAILALKVLEKDAEDAGANQTAGLYLAFVRKDFASALPMLAKANDETLRDLAAKEASDPADVEEQEKLASAWWDAAEAAPPAFRDDYKLRAGYWYEQSLPNLSVLLANRAEQRLKEIEETIGAERIAAKTKSAAQTPSSVEGVAHIAVDDLAEVRVNGEPLATVRVFEEAKVPVSLKIGDVITARLVDNGGAVGFRMIFGNKDRSRFFFTNSQTWFMYAPEDESQWWSVTPDRDHSPAATKVSQLFVQYPKTEYVIGLGAETIWGKDKSKSHVYHVVNEADFEEVAELDYRFARRTGPKVKGTLYATGSDWFDLAINGIPFIGGTKAQLSSKPVEIQQGDVITARIMNQYDNSRGLQLVFLSDDQKTAFGTHHNTWFEYPPEDPQRFWEIPFAKRYPNAVPTKGIKMLLDDRPDLTANLRLPLERVYRSDGGKWGTACLFHVVTKDDLAPR